MSPSNTRGVSDPDPPEEVVPQREVMVTARVSADLWGRWMAKCKILGIRPSTQLAVLIAGFVSDSSEIEEDGNDG